MSILQIYRWKGKIVKKETYDNLIRSQELGKNNKGRKALKRPLENNKEKFDDEDDMQRIVSLKVLGENLWCSFCKEALSLSNFQSEKLQGFGFTLIVKCHKCLVLNEVITGRKRTTPDEKKTLLFQRNFTAALGNKFIFKILLQVIKFFLFSFMY